MGRGLGSSKETNKEPEKGLLVQYYQSGLVARCVLLCPSACGHVQLLFRQPPKMKNIGFSWVCEQSSKNVLQRTKASYFDLYVHSEMMYSGSRKLTMNTPQRFPEM